MTLRKRVVVSLIGVVAAVILSCAGLTAYILLDRGPQGAAAYPKFRATNASYIPFMPTSLTPGMTGVRFMTQGFEPTGFMAQDGYVELRFVLTPAEAAALEATSTAAAATLAAGPGDMTVESCAEIISGLETADDGNRATPLPAGFRSFILFRQGASIGGVTVNAASGEVIYWRFNF